MTLAQAVPSLTGHSPIESEHGGQRWVLVKEFINSPRPGRWCTRSRGQPGHLHRNKWRHGRKQGWKQGYNMGPKSIQKVRPNTGLQTIYKVHSACLNHETRYLQHSTKAHPESRFTYSEAHAEAEGPGLSLNGVPDRGVGPR